MGQAGILGIALGTGIGGVIIGNASMGSSVSPMSVAGHSLLMVGMVIIALWIAQRLPGRFQQVMAAEQGVGIH